MTKELINDSVVLYNVEASTKEEVISILAEAMDADGRLQNKDTYEKDVLHREGIGSTAVGFMIATPHAKSNGVKESTIAFAKLKNPIKWDNQQVELVFQIGVPSTSPGDEHLEILSLLFRNLVHADFREKLNLAIKEKDVVALIKSLSKG